MTKGGDVMDPWSVASLTLVGAFIGAWVAAAIFIRPPRPAPVPAPPPLPPPPLVPASLLPPDLQEELEDAARDRREALAELRAARMRREARDARVDASAASSTGGTAGGAPSTTPPPRPSRPTPAAGGAAAAAGAAAPTRPWGDRHLALPGEGVEFIIAAADRTAAAPLGITLEVTVQKRGETWFVSPCGGTEVEGRNARDHLLNCSTCKAAYRLN